jgi:hypothetical protein
VIAPELQAPDGGGSETIGRSFDKDFKDADLDVARSSVSFVRAVGTWVSSPEGMDDNEVFVTIEVDSTASKPCAPGPGWHDPKIATTPMSIDSEATTVYVPLNGVVAVVKHKGWCYWFSFLNRVGPES